MCVKISSPPSEHKNQLTDSLPWATYRGLLSLQGIGWNNVSGLLHLVSYIFHPCRTIRRCCHNSSLLWPALDHFNQSSHGFYIYFLCLSQDFFFGPSVFYFAYDFPVQGLFSYYAVFPSAIFFSRLHFDIRDSFHLIVRIFPWHLFSKVWSLYRKLMTCIVWNSH